MLCKKFLRVLVTNTPHNHLPAASLPDLAVLQLHLNLCGVHVVASPCIQVNLHLKGFICIDLLFGLTCRAANPVIDQSTRIDSFEGSA